MNEAKPGVETYPQLKREFFKSKRDEAERKLNWWANSNRIDKYPITQIEDMCKQYGFEMSCYQDALANTGYEVSE